MKKMIFILLILIFQTLILNCVAQVNQEWVARYNGPASYDDLGYALAIDGSGNVYVTGWSYGGSTFDDATTIKYNSSGVQQWVQRYNGPYSRADQFYSIVLDDASNAYAAGFSTRSSTVNRYLVIKYNTSGVQQWVSVADTGKAWSVAIDTAGYIYVTGTSTTSSPYVTKKYDQAGTVIWTRVYAYGKTDFYPQLKCDLFGNIYVAGTAGPGYDYCVVKYNSNGDSLWVRKYNSPFNNADFSYALTTDNAGNVIVVGTSDGGISTSYDILTVKYNSAGVFQWATRYNDPSYIYDFGWGGIATDQAGNVYVTGSTEDGMSFYGDMITIKYNSAGVQQWVARYNGANNGVEYSWGIAVDNSGNSYITGSSPANYSTGNIVAVKYNPSGVQQWVQIYNGPANDLDGGQYIALDNFGNVYVTGSSREVGTNDDITTIKYSQPVGITPVSNEIPKEFKLYQNYPNPFNPKTIISFQLPVVGFATLKVYDILAREVITLVNEELKPGTYEIEWDAANYPSGVYFYKLFSENFTQSMKMVLVK